jgi:hypothetical protein
LGRNVSTVVDTNELPPEKALKFLEIMEDTDFFALPENPNSFLESAPGADHLCYKVTVEVAGIQHTVETSDTAAPPRLQPLLQELSQYARHEPPGGLPGNNF